MKWFAVLLLGVLVLANCSANAEMAGVHGLVYLSAADSFGADCDEATGTLYFKVGNGIYSYHPESGWKRLVYTLKHIEEIIYADGCIIYATQHPFGMNCDVVVLDLKTGESKTIHPEIPGPMLMAASPDEAVIATSYGETGITRCSLETGQCEVVLQDCAYVAIAHNGLTVYEASQGWDFYSFSDGESHHLHNKGRENSTETCSPVFWVEMRPGKELDIYLEGQKVHTVSGFENAAISERYVLWYTGGEDERQMQVYDLQAEDPSDAIKSYVVTARSNIYIVGKYAAMLGPDSFFGFRVNLVDLETGEEITLSY